MIIKDSLAQLGFSDNEAKVYLALLELGEAPVSQIAANAGIKRPTCYLTLDQLEKKGFVAVVPFANKIHYRASKPTALLHAAEDYMQQAKSLVPLLASLYGQDSLSPKVKLFEGKSGQKVLFTEILQTLSAQKQPEIVWFANWESLEARRPGELARSFRVHSKKKVKKREIIQDTPKARELVKQYAYANFTNKFVPSEKSIGIDLGITGNKVALFSLSAPLFGVLIEHKIIADSLRAIFELAWQGIDSNLD